MTLSLSRYLGVIVLLIPLALFLRLARISNESLDGDEMFSRRVATSNTPEALHLIREDLVHPPLYYLILKTILPAGHPASALNVRSLSLAAGAASLVVVILIGWVVAPLRAPAILAAFLLALNKMHIFYSQQARSYAFFCLLTAMLLLWSFLMDRFGQRWWYWLAGTMLMTVLIYVHYFGAFYCAAVVFAIVLTNWSKQFRMRAMVCLLVAFAAFLPWVYQESAVYHAKGLSSNLGWHEPPTLFDLRITFSDYLGVPEFRGATSVVFLIEAALIGLALFPEASGQKDRLDLSVRAALVFTAFMPPLLAFILARWPFGLPIYGERHVFPSILPVVLLASYGLWRAALLTRKVLRVPVLVAGAACLCILQAFPVLTHWSEPTREPYAVIADRLKSGDLGFPVYTTWTYGIGEPVSFYLAKGKGIDELPSDPAKLPDTCIVLYRPAEKREDAAVRSVLGQFDIVEAKYYAAGNSIWGTRLIVLRRHKDGAVVRMEGRSGGAIVHGTSESRGSNPPASTMRALCLRPES